LIGVSPRVRGFTSIHAAPGASGSRFCRLESTRRWVRKVHLIVLSPIALWNVQIRNRSGNFVLNLRFHSRSSVSGRRVVVFVRFRRPLWRRSRRRRSSLTVVIASSPIVRRVCFTPSAAEAAVLMITTSVSIIINLAIIVPTIPEFPVAVSVSAAPTLPPTRSLRQTVLFFLSVLNVVSVGIISIITVIIQGR
jgi:hypothetical protein